MIDDIDRRIISRLARDGRRAYADLAEDVGLSQSACHRRVKRLEDEGYITGYAALVDRKKIGLSIMGYVAIKMESHDSNLLEKFTEGVREIDDVVACYAISGGGDYLLQVVAADMDAFADVALKKLVTLPGVKDSTTNFVLSTIKTNIDSVT